MSRDLRAEPVVDDSSLSGLLLRVGDGDLAAYELVYDHVAARVLGMATRVVRDHHQSREVAQEVMLEVWRSAASFDPARGSAWGWMMTLTHRRAVDRVRSAHASTRRDTAWHIGRQVVDTYNTDDTWESAHSSLQAARVRLALRKLSPPQRQAIEMAYFGGWTHSEIALLLGLPLGTAKDRIHTGLRRLREELNPHLDTRDQSRPAS